MTKETHSAPQWRVLLDRVGYETRRVFKQIQPSAHTGMGAVPHDSGADFRVWAPHAEKVFVSGDFNRWSPWQSPLASEGNGYWSGSDAKAIVGSAYKFVLHYQGQTHLRTDPYAADVAGSQRHGVICAPLAPLADDFQPPPLNELIIYELHVGTFNHNGRSEVGAFQDVIEKLPYLQELGINAIEIMPVKEFAGDYSWGYNPAFPFALTRTYGGRAAFQELVSAAHNQGIAVIIDVVYNHFGPQDLSLWQFDGWQENDKGGIYFYNDWRSNTPWADTRPDYGRSEVRQFIRDNVLMWLETYGVDGLRWDATNFIRNVHGHDGDPSADIAEGWNLMQWLNQEVKERYPHKIMIAEDLQNNARITEATETGGAGFTAQWDARFVHPIRHAVITAVDEDRDITAVSQALTTQYNGDPWSRVIYTESHDEVANGKARVPEEIANGDANSYFAKKRATLGAALVFTATGIPMIFQGQEFLEDGWFDDHKPLDWQKADQNSGILALYQDLIRLRRNLNGHTLGLTGSHIHVFHTDPRHKLIAFHRWRNGGPGDDVIIVANFANQSCQGRTIGLPHAGLWRVRFNSDAQAYDPTFIGLHCPDIIAAPTQENLTIDHMPYLGNVALAPYSVLILSQD
ncbi:MAG: alpha-amylase family glycosyl hydrolase [Chloroflexota bacterium]